MKNWFKVFFIFSLLGLVVYFNSLNNKFLIDDFVLLSNPVSSQTKFISSQWNPYREQAWGVMDSQANLGDYRPLSRIVYDLCYAFFKNNYWQYHLLSLVLFVFACSLVYLLIGQITGNYNLAFLVGLFFLVHPINGIVVNYICSRVVSLLLIFILGAIILLWESLERKNNRTLYFLSLLLALLSLFWHELAMMAPLYIAAVILLLREGPLKKKVIYLLPYFLIVLVYLAFRAFFISTDSTISHLSLLPMTGWEYLATLFRLMAWYIIQLFYPCGIVMQWATPVLHRHIFWDNLGIIALLILFILSYARFSKDKIGRLAIIWILIGFAPLCSASFSNPYYGIFVEPHWFIFSSIGFFILAARFCLFVLDRNKNIGFVLLFILILAWGSVSHANNRLWRDQKTYTLYWSRQLPDFKPVYRFIAESYQSERAFNEARKYFRMALSGYPTSDIGTYSNLGIMDSYDHHWKRAEFYFNKVLKIDPSFASAYNILGDIYLRLGQEGKARDYFNRSLIFDPLSLEPRINLASISLKHAQYPQALKLCFENLDIMGDDPQTLLLLVDIFKKQRDMVDLKKYAYRLLNVETEPQPLTRIGIMMAQDDAPEIALDYFTKVMRVAPDYKDAYLATGTLFANRGQYDRAIHIWKLGSSIDPSDKRFDIDITKAMKLR